MGNTYSNQQQRREDDSKGRIGLAKALAFFLLCLLVVAMWGCSATLEKAVAQCFALDGEPEFTTASGVEKFSCRRPAVLTTRAAR